MSMTPERAGEVGKEYLDRCMGNRGVTPSEEFLKRRAEETQGHPSPELTERQIARERSIAETVGTDPGNKIKEADARLRRGMSPVHSAKVIRTRTSY